MIDVHILTILILQKTVLNGTCICELGNEVMPLTFLI